MMPSADHHFLQAEGKRRLRCLKCQKPLALWAIKAGRRLCLKCFRENCHMGRVIHDRPSYFAHGDHLGDSFLIPGPASVNRAFDR